MHTFKNNSILYWWPVWLKSFNQIKYLIVLTTYVLEIKIILQIVWIQK